MLKRTAAAAVVVFSSWTSAYGGDGEKPLVFDGERAKTYVAHLSSDALEGRMSCTDGYRKAAEWAAGRFAEWGLKPAGEDGTYFQKVSTREFDWNTGLPTLHVGGREFLLDDGDFSVHSASTPATTLQGEVVFVGYGIAAPAKGLNEYDGVDVQGRVVLALTGSPKNAPALEMRFQRAQEAPKDEKKKPEEQWEAESADASKIKTAYEKGASAVLLYDPDESRDSAARPSPSWRGSAPRAFAPERKFLSFTIRERVFRAIMKRDPQESPQGLKRRIDHARREIKEKKKPQSRKTGVLAVLKGYDVSLRYDEQHRNNVANNVLAKIEGTDPKMKDQYVLTGAHLDHLGVRNGYVYNGADDNASGSGVVLEAARVFSQSSFKPGRTLVFCLWGGEELGLLGSNHFGNKPCGGVVMDKVVAYFNVDMVGMGESLNAPGALNFPSIWDVIRRGQDPNIMKRIKPQTGGPSGSDHTAFIKRGIEAMALMSGGGGGHQDYHHPEDDAEKIEPEMLRVAGQFVVQGMVNLASDTTTQLLVDRREDLYRAIRIEISNFNPDLPNSLWTRVPVEAKTKEALYDQILDRARELLRAASSSGGSPGGSAGSGPSPPAKKSLARGLADFKPIAGDIRLLKLSLDFHSIGRADIQGDDGVWVVQGRLTDPGKEALKTLEENSVAVRLISPSETLLSDVLSAASKPFIVTGDYDIKPDMADRLNSRGVLFGINFDPGKVADFIASVEKAKKQLGERKALFAYLTAVKGLEEAKKPLYLGLIDAGWSHNEICGGREHRGLLGGAQLSAPGPQAERPR